MKRAIPFAAVQRLIRGYGLTSARVADILGCSFNTGASRLRDPGKLTLRELCRLADAAGIPLEELRAALRP